MSDPIEEILNQQTHRQDETGIEKAIGQIADKMSFAEVIERLMQLTRVNAQEKEAFAILYALDKGKLKSRVLSDYLMARLSLANSEKGRSRDEMIELVKAGTPQVPKGFWGKLKQRVEF